MKKLEKGFTLIELMIVVAIIGILSAVAAPRFGKQIARTKDAKALSLVGTWRSALNLNYADEMKYATTFVELENYVDAGTMTATKDGSDDVNKKAVAGTPEEIDFGIRANDGTSVAQSQDAMIKIITDIANTAGTTWSSL